MSAIGAIGSFGSISGYVSLYQNRQSLPAGTQAVERVARGQTAPVPPVSQVPTVQRGSAQSGEELLPRGVELPTLREGADPAEMAVRGRIRYLEGEELQNLTRSGDQLDRLTGEEAQEGGVSGTGEESKSPQQVMEEAECQTCKNRKYQDGSDEMVSFKSAAHISPESSASRVMAHEQEHVSNAYSRAAKAGGKVVSASVSLKTAICPECGRSYVAGGATSTQIKYPNEKNPYSQNKKNLDAISLIGSNLDIAV